MNYSKIYFNIINRARKRELHGYTEKHHVVPKCLGGSDLPTNIVILTADEHFLCHQLLVKMFPKNSKLLLAIVYMTSGKHKNRINNKIFGQLRKKLSENWKGDKNPQRINPRSGERHHYYNKKREPFMSDAGKLQLSTRMKNNNPNKGKNPWELNSTTEITFSIWKKADVIYKIWEEDKSVSYGVLYRKYFGESYNHKTGKGKPIGTFATMIGKFRAGWIPNSDLEWKQLNDK